MASTVLVSVDSPRVLVVDDDESLLRACERLLSRRGFRVAAVRNCRAAFGLIDSGALDVVLCDVVMPGLGGITLLRLAHEHNPDLPIVLMTGQATVRSAVRAIAEGAFAYLRKPFDDLELERTLRRAAA